MSEPVMHYIETYMADAARICGMLDKKQMESMVNLLVETKRNGGRIFFLGVGGSAANASHAVNDFRKIAGIESYCPTDNVSELTARTNDDGWAVVFCDWLAVSRLNSKDMIFVLSVGGGNLAANVSPCLVKALQFAQEKDATIVGIVGRDGGYTAQVADACVIVPTLDSNTITPHAEAFQGTVWHMMVSHPALRARQMKWESTPSTQPTDGRVASA